MVFPVPTEVPPQDPLYHFHDPPVPRLPPLTVRLTDVLPQVESAEAAIAVAAVLLLWMVMVLAAHTVVLQRPSART